MKNIKITFFLILAAILFYGITLFLSDISLIFDKISEINFSYLLIVLLLIAFQICIHGFKYHRLLKKLNIHLTFKESLLIFTAGLAMLFTPGGLGTAIKSQIVKMRHGKPISSNISIIYFEKWTELLSVLILMTILLPWVDIYESKIVIIFGYLFIIFFVGLVSNNKSFQFLKNFSSKIKPLKKFTESLDETKESITILNSPKNILEMTSLSLINKSLQMISVYLIFLSLEIDLGFFETAQIFFTSQVLGILSLVPGGIIVVESSLLGFLIQNNISFSVATLLVIILRIFITWIPTLIGITTFKFIFSKKT